MIIERLSREHRNLEKLLAILERELEIFDRGDRPDYQVIHAIISYFEVYPRFYGQGQANALIPKRLPQNQLQIKIVCRWEGSCRSCLH